PALRVVVERLPATIQLTAAAMLLTALFGVAIGIVTAVRARHALRLCRHRRRGPRAVAAELLARHHAYPLVRRRAPLVTDVRLRGLAPPRAARHHAGGLSHRARGTAHALEHARDPEPRLHPHRPREGSGRARGYSAPRAAQRCHPGADRARIADRH